MCEYISDSIHKIIREIQTIWEQAGGRQTTRKWDGMDNNVGVRRFEERVKNASIKECNNGHDLACVSLLSATSMRIECFSLMLLSSTLTNGKINRLLHPIVLTLVLTLTRTLALVLTLTFSIVRSTAITTVAIACACTAD